MLLDTGIDLWLASACQRYPLAYSHLNLKNSL